jgi:hypothetical protein
MDANQIRLRASIASLSAWDRCSPEQRSARGRNGNQGLVAKFEREAIAEGATTPAQIRAAVKTKYRKHIQRMTYNSLKARQAKAQALTARAAELKAQRDKAGAA